MKYIDADKITWHDLRENGLHEASDMIAFKDEVDELESFPTIADIITERNIAIAQLNELGIEFGEKPEQKAIPIEWLESWSDNDDITSHAFSWADVGFQVIQDVIEDWRKENGTQNNIQ